MKSATEKAKSHLDDQRKEAFSNAKRMATKISDAIYAGNKANHDQDKLVAAAEERLTGATVALGKA